MKDIKVVGLTGGIGTGKSTAAEFLKKAGFAHVDADEISRGLTADGSPMLAVLDDVFGPKGQMGCEGVEILDENGSLKRKILASVVFVDENKKHKLDELMFSAIIGEIDRQIAQVRNAADDSVCGILIDAPLLFEAGLDDRCDLILLITADMDVRIKRVCTRDGVNPQDVRNRINNQMSDSEKIERSDVIVENSTTKEDFEAKLKEFQKYFTKFSENSCNGEKLVL